MEDGKLELAGSLATNTYILELMVIFLDYDLIFKLGMTYIIVRRKKKGVRVYFH